MGREKSTARAASVRRHNPIARPQNESPDDFSRETTPTPESSTPTPQKISASPSVITPATPVTPTPNPPPTKTSPVNAPMEGDHDEISMDQPLPQPGATPNSETTVSHPPSIPPVNETPTSTLSDEQILESFFQVAEINRGMAAYTPNIMAAGLGKFTPIPEGGFPQIHLLSPGQLTDDMHRPTLRNWTQLPGPKVLARIFDYDGSDPSGMNPIATRRIKDAVDEIAKAIHAPNRDCKVSPPVPAEAFPIQSSPNAFLIYNITEDIRATLLAQRVWSSSTITFEIRELAPRTMPSLYVNLAGITTSDTTTVRNTVQGVWRDPTHKHLINITLREHDPHLQNKPLPELSLIVDRFIASVRIEFLDCKVVGGLGAPRFNVLADSPTSSVHAWTALRHLVSTFVYTTQLDGVGEVTRFFYCTLCHSIAHPRGLCEFPNILMWNGPLHDGKPKNGGNGSRANGPRNRRN